jgi:Uma2 family endonuclease
VLAQRLVWPDRIRPLRRVQYEALVEQGLFDDSRVELLFGSLVDVSPQGPLHAAIIARLTRRLAQQLPSTMQLRVQSPLALSDDSEPEPDIAVVPEADYTSSHPTRAVFVIEVAETSLQKDRVVKAGLYATAGVDEYWLVNLSDKEVEVNRQPRGGRYEQVDVLRPSVELSPHAFPAVRFTVGELVS